MTRLPFASVAAINGAAVGAGVTVALLCDFVVIWHKMLSCPTHVSHFGLLDGAAESCCGRC